MTLTTIAIIALAWLGVAVAVGLMLGQVFAICKRED